MLISADYICCSRTVRRSFLSLKECHHASRLGGIFCEIQAREVYDRLEIPLEERWMSFR